MDCQAAVRNTLFRCNPNSSDYEACLQADNLSTNSGGDLQNVVRCQIDGYTTPLFLTVPGGNGQQQRVYGMPIHGQIARYATRE